MTPPSAMCTNLREVPAHQAPQAEVGEEVHDVQPAVGDEDAGAEVDAVVGATAARDHRARTAIAP